MGEDSNRHAGTVRDLQQGVSSSDRGAELAETIHPDGACETASDFRARRFGRYELLRPLGTGGMGHVFLALDTVLDRRVALKIPRQSGSGVSAESDFLQRFAREARAAASLKHANICSVYDAGEIDGTAYITMDFIDGQPLSRLTGSGQFQPLTVALRLLATIADAIGHAHARGVIHRDLKPGNIMIDSDGQPIVTDFGLARRQASAADGRITHEGLLIGTPGYMAPEQVRGEQALVGVGSDIYSLGVIAFELLTGRLPFTGSAAEILAKVLRDPPPVPSSLRADLPPELDAFVLKLLEKEPEQRYLSMPEVSAVLATLLEGSVDSGLKPTVPRTISCSSQPVGRPLKRQRLIISGFVFGLLCLLAGTVIYLKSGSLTLAVTVDDAWLKEQGGEVTLMVDGDEHRITAGAGGSQPLAVVVKTGEHEFSVRHGDSVVINPRRFTIERGGRSVLQITADDMQLRSDVPAERPVPPGAGMAATEAGVTFSPESAAAATLLQREWGERLRLPVELTGEFGVPLRLIPPGTFQMGSPDSEPYREATEGPRHTVRIDTPFYLGATEVTQGQWFAVMQTRPWEQQPTVQTGDAMPAVGVDWYGAMEFCRRMSAKTGSVWRLPSEAEWEYACRAGAGTTWHFGANVEELSGYAWFDANASLVSEPWPHETGRLKPNAFGLHDMHGNVFEWCRDVYVPLEFGTRTGITVNPQVEDHAEPLEMRVTRGGGFDWNGYDIRCAFRGRAVPDFFSERDGFRVVREIGEQDAGTLPAHIETELPALPPAGQPATAPFSAAEALAFQESWSAHLGLPQEYVNSIGMRFRLIPPGTFVMGSSPTEIAAASADPRLDLTNPERLKIIESEGPQRLVRISQPFYLGVMEVTQLQLELVLGRQTSNYSRTGAGAGLIGQQDRTRAPAEMLTWSDAVEFLEKLSQQENLAAAWRDEGGVLRLTGGGGYRLPTEAEWEYACRAGTQTRFWTGDDEEQLMRAAVTAMNSGGRPPRMAGGRPGNPFGLIDMHGNVGEWVHDGWKAEVVQQANDNGELVDPRLDGGVEDQRIIRGGSHYTAPVECRSASRYVVLNGTVWTETGFRAALSVEAVRQLLDAAQ